MKISYSWKIYGLAVAVRLIAFIVFFRLFGDAILIFSDSREYIGLAQALFEGGGFVYHGIEYAGRTAGYPLLLAAFRALTSSLAAFSVFQILVASVIPVLTLNIAKELGFSKRAGFIAGIAAAAEPHMVFYSFPILPDTIFTVLFLLFVLFGIRYSASKRLQDLMIAAALFGIGMHVKPAFQLYSVTAVIGLMTMTIIERSRTYLFHAMAFLAIVFAVTSPWMFRMQRVTGAFEMSSQGSAMVATKLAPSVMSVDEHVSFDRAERVLEERWDKHDPPLGEIASYLLKRPGALTTVIAANTLLLWTSHNYAYIPSYLGVLNAPEGYSDVPPSHLLMQGRFGDLASVLSSLVIHPYFLLASSGKVIWLFICVLFFYGMFRSIARDAKHRYAHVLIASLVLTYTATVWVNGFAVEGRLRLPFFPLMFIYAAGLSAAIGRAGCKRIIRTTLLACLIPFRWIMQVIRPVQEVTILFYHSVSDRDDAYAVTPSRFEEQMKIVKRVSHPVPLHDVVLFARGEKQLPRNATAVTFDDGYWDTLLNALPILKTYDIPATVFVTTHPHAAEIGNDAPLLGQDGIRALSHEMLIDIGSHGATHRKLTRLGANDLRSELEDSKSYLETLTGKPCRFLAFPKGRSNDIVRDAVRQTGYEAALTTVHGLVRKGDDPFALKRIIVKRDTGHFEFRWRLTRIVDWMNKLWHVYTDYAG